MLKNDDLDLKKQQKNFHSFTKSFYKTVFSTLLLSIKLFENKFFSIQRIFN